MNNVNYSSEFCVVLCLFLLATIESQKKSCALKCVKNKILKSHPAGTPPGRHREQLETEVVQYLLT
jgi:hypothetical protein